MPTLIDKLKIKVQKINFFFNNGGRYCNYTNKKRFKGKGPSEKIN